MPSTSVFDQQDAGYKQAVLPVQVSARIAIEASHADYWYKVRGPGRPHHRHDHLW